VVNRVIAERDAILCVHGRCNSVTPPFKMGGKGNRGKAEEGLPAREEGKKKPLI